MSKNYNFSPMVNDSGSFLFTSLVDYRNNYFISNNPEMVIEFYNSFNNRLEIIQWMRERPKENCAIKEMEGNKEIIVVIPTIDINSEFAKNCKNNIFRGLHIIFVESGSNNFYFNYAHNCNLDIIEALKSNLKWIILSNDDMEKIDEPEILKKELSKIDPMKYALVFTSKSKYHSIIFSINRYGLIYKKFFPKVYRNKQKFYGVQDKFDLRYGIVIDTRIKESNRTSIINYLILNYLITKPIIKDIKLSASFTIISTNFIRECLKQNKNGKLLDETFVNAHEDLDFSIRMFLSKSQVAEINYKIGDLVGSSLGNTYCRQLRTVAGDIYFLEKYSTLLG